MCIRDRACGAARAFLTDVLIDRLTVNVDDIPSLNLPDLEMDESTTLVEAFLEASDTSCELLLS